MKAPSGYDTAEAKTGGDFSQPEAGGYIFRILDVEETTSKAGNDMIVLNMDIAEGEFKNYYAELHKRLDLKNWPLKYYQLVNEDNADYYKGMIQSVAKSNPSFRDEAFTGPEHDIGALEKMLVGGVMRMEQYQKKDGTIGDGLKILYLCSVQRIEDGDFQIPKPKLLQAVAQKQDESDDLPWD